MVICSLWYDKDIISEVSTWGDVWSSLWWSNRYPWFRSIRTDSKAHHIRTILSCQEFKSIFWRQLEAAFPVVKDCCVLGNLRLPLIWSRHQQLSVLPSLPGCCFDLFTSQSRSAVLDTTDMPLPSTQLETSHSTFGMELTQSLEDKTVLDDRENSLQLPSNYGFRLLTW